MAPEAASTTRSHGSIRTSSPRSRRRSGSATRTSRSSTELRSHAARLGRSPTMKEFAADPETHVHPQTVIEHFGTWNAAKRAAGLVPRRFATREELLEVLRAPRRGARPDADRARPRRAPRPDAVEVALLAHVRLAQRRAARGRATTSRSARSGSSGRSSRAPSSPVELGRLPKFADWASVAARTAPGC